LKTGSLLNNLVIYNHFSSPTFDYGLRNLTSPPASNLSSSISLVFLLFALLVYNVTLSSVICLQPFYLHGLSIFPYRQWWFSAA